MKFNIWQCILIGVYNTLRYTFPDKMSGHSWVESEFHENCTVIITKCEVCGKTEISWHKS